ncbi:MAG: ImmA/IrrE family metallo-endopeptidase [Euryhalocaulis sp.]|uniref:helix-turn-helix domain-containing protein n=1 Tax=Euryhalocaulis sp. TaxID=2744307 RepID=UPI0017F1A7D4|nr:ImmA/IrrE family metallo-endopeptidase [Euryhalocaulis sp.]MBA4802510.1 ImmA/IrrE family metallo-endopeptidase [Euryhalocaulis sp.]
MANSKILQFPTAAREDTSGRRLIPGRLKEARLAAKLNQAELAREVGIQRQNISYYEQGDRNPEPGTLSDLAKALGQPVRYFLSEPADTFGPQSVNFFRKVGADTKRRNDACAVFASWYAQTARVFDPQVNFPEVDLPSFEPSDSEAMRYEDEEIESIAESVREHFGLGFGPISNVIRLLEKQGILVTKFQMPGEQVEAFSFWSGARPFVFLASDKESAVRARFDAAHELGHLVLHRWIGAEDIEDKKRLAEIEKEANRFAGAFLLPRKTFPNEVYSPRVEGFVDLKYRWKVAIQAMVYRCKDLGIFDEHQITNLYKQISYKKWRKKEPGDGPDGIEAERPLLLNRVAELVLDSGRMTKSDLKSKLAISSEIIERFLSLPAGSLADDQIEPFEPTLKS